MNTQSRYPIKVSKYSSHSQISQLIQRVESNGERLRLIDIGCSTGGLYQLISQMNIEYLGIEPFEKDFNFAISQGLNVARLTAEEAVEKIDQKFNFVIFADVLEHLVQPQSVLNAAGKLLVNEGRIIISLPNVAHVAIRILHLLGNWNYTERGILDETHLRFFTCKTAIDLVHKSGYEIVSMAYTPVPVEALNLRLPTKIMGVLDYLSNGLTRLAPKLFAFQFIIECRKIN